MFVTLGELLKELRMVGHGQRKYYQLYVLVTRSDGVDFQSYSQIYRVTDESSEEAVLTLILTETSRYPHIGVGDVVRLDRFVAQFRDGTIECRVIKPEKIVVFPKNDPNNINPKSAAENPTFYPSDVTKVAALRALNIGTVGEPYSFSNVSDNGRESDVVAQLVGFQELNDQKGLFAFCWDGTRCPVRNLIHFKRFNLDSPANRKAIEKHLLLRSKGFLHHLFLFDNIAGYVSSLEPGSFVFMEGVRVAYKKTTKELYLTCKGNIELLNPNDRNVAKLKDRLSKVPLPPPGTMAVAPGEEDDDDDSTGNQAPKKFLKSRHNASRVEVIDLTSETEGSSKSWTAATATRRENSTMMQRQPKISGQRANPRNGSIVSFQVENENPFDDPQPSTSTASNNQRDVSTGVDFVTSKGQSRSQMKRKREATATLVLNGATKTSYHIPRDKLLELEKHLENISVSVGSDVSNYVTAESSPTKPPRQPEIDQESLAKILMDLDSQVDGIFPSGSTGSLEDVTSDVVLQVRVASPSKLRASEGGQSESKMFDACNSLASGTIDTLSMQLRLGSQMGELQASAFLSTQNEKSQISPNMETESDY